METTEDKSEGESVQTFRERLEKLSPEERAKLLASYTRDAAVSCAYAGVHVEPQSIIPEK
jgi:hypothetical protein